MNKEHFFSSKPIDKYQIIDPKNQISDFPLKDESFSFFKGTLIETISLPKYSMKEIDKMNGTEFERFLSVIFTQKGFNVVNLKDSGDNGVDLLIEKNNEKIAIQAKRYGFNKKVGNDTVLKLAGGSQYYSCNRKIIITTSNYTFKAVECAKKVNVELWSRTEVELLLDFYHFFSGLKKRPKREKQ